MQRLLGFVFDPNSDDATAQLGIFRQKLSCTAKRWATVLQTRGLEVWHANGSIGASGTCLKGQGFTIVGRVFTKSSVQLSSLPSAAQKAAVATLLSDAKAFMASHWGGYIAFACTDGGSRVVVARDPSGALPCYTIRIGSLRIFFSDVADLFACTPLRLTINTQFVEASLLLPNLPKRITGFHEITEVLPGEHWSIKNDTVNTGIGWDPYQLIQGNESQSAEEAATAVLSAAKTTVNALAGCFQRVNVQLGGLDSSAVLALLAEAPSRPDINVLNLYTTSPRGDERSFARLVAADAGLALIERELDATRVTLDRVIATRTW